MNFFKWNFRKFAKQFRNQIFSKLAHSTIHSVFFSFSSLSFCSSLDVVQNCPSLYFKCNSMVQYRTLMLTLIYHQTSLLHFLFPLLDFYFKHRVYLWNCIDPLNVIIMHFQILYDYTIFFLSFSFIRNVSDSSKRDDKYGHIISAILMTREVQGK